MSSLLLAGLLGLCLGSFLNVVVYRLPQRVSVVQSRSACPSCAQLLAWYDLLPLLSFAWLKGRCRTCQARIPWPYPVVEGTGAGIVVGSVCIWGWTGWTIYYGGFALVLLAAAIIDARHRMIPNRLLAFGAGLGLLLLALLAPKVLPLRLLQALTAAGVVWLLRRVSIGVFRRPGMGMGDVKLAVLLGLYLGWSGLWVLYLGAFLGGLYAIGGLVAGRFTRRTEVPLAPFIALATGLYAAFPWLHLAYYL